MLKALIDRYRKAKKPDVSCLISDLRALEIEKAWVVEVKVKVNCGICNGRGEWTKPDEEDPEIPGEIERCLNCNGTGKVRGDKWKLHEISLTELCPPPKGEDWAGYRIRLVEIIKGEMIKGEISEDKKSNDSGV